jgi:GNAT superfamily N-acetyltransferase
LALTRWLQERAQRNQVSGASRCFVVCDAQQNVLGYYALAAGAVSHGIAPGSIRRNMPHPIPVIVLGRLAVHADWTGQGIGAGLLKDAVQRTLHVCREIGARALVCHAMDEMAKAFYLRHGFIESPMDAMTVMLPVA